MERIEIWHTSTAFESVSIRICAGKNAGIEIPISEALGAPAWFGLDITTGAHDEHAKRASEGGIRVPTSFSSVWGIWGACSRRSLLGTRLERIREPFETSLNVTWAPGDCEDQL